MKRVIEELESDSDRLVADLKEKSKRETTQPPKGIQAGGGWRLKKQ
jgi:hypothetical protein